MSRPPSTRPAHPPHAHPTAATGSPSTDTETLARFEVMDGCPVRGEVVPVRLPLAGLPVTPSAVGPAQPFSVRYFLNLVLIDEEDRRYFKQQEILLWRRAGGGGGGEVWLPGLKTAGA